MLKIDSNNKCTRPTFSSNYRMVILDKGKFYQNTTTFFRPDMNWGRLVELLANKYKNANKVNVFNMACSDGSEPFTLAISLMEKFGKDAKKFFPIKATDMDRTIINRAKNERCNLSEADLLRLYNATDGDFSNYFHFYRTDDLQYPFTVKATNKLSENIQFNVAKIMDEVKNIPAENYIVLCRNCWVYMNHSDQFALAEELSRRLTPSSLVLLGSLENSYGHSKILEQFGFRMTDVKNVYSKFGG